MNKKTVVNDEYIQMFDGGTAMVLKQRSTHVYATNVSSRLLSFE